MSIVYKTIPQDDQSVTTFKVYKSWEYTDTSANRFKNLYSASVYLGTAIKPNPNDYTGDLMSLDFDKESDTNDASRLLNTHLQNTPTGMLWYALRHKYFNDYNDFISFTGNAEALNLPTSTTGWDGLTFTTTTASLNKSYNYIEDKTNPSSSYRLPSIASVISIPQLKFGEEIKPGSFELIISSSIGNSNQKYYTLRDDGMGNIVDSIITSSIKINNCILHLNFDETEYESKINKFIYADPRYPAEINVYNLAITNSPIQTNITSIFTASYGLSGNFNSSYIRIDGSPSYFNPKINDDYAISFWFKVNNTTPTQYLVTKRGLKRDYALISRSGQRSAGNIWNKNENIFPYNIYISNGNLTAQVSDGTTLVNLSSAIDSNTHHCSFIKSGSIYKLYIDGTETGTSNTSLSSITNKSDIFIGSFTTKDGDLTKPYLPVTGSIDEIKFFNTFLTANEVKSLSTNNLTGNIENRYSVGKIFYKEGIIVLNSTHPKFGSKYNTFNNSGYLTTLPFSSTLYNNSPNTINHNGIRPTTSTPAFSNLCATGSYDNITVKWNSTVTLYENEILCRIREDEFNVTLNPTILKNQENSYIPQDFVFNDEFTPYITTIGLYNDKAELLAIGKLANPIKKRPDVDLNIIIRFDQ